MEKQFIPLSVPNLKGNELAYVTEAIKTEWVSTAGPYIADFEKAAADYVHVHRNGAGSPDPDIPPWKMHEEPDG